MPPPGMLPGSADAECVHARVGWPGFNSEITQFCVCFLPIKQVTALRSSFQFLGVASWVRGRGSRSPRSWAAGTRGGGGGGRHAGQSARAAAARPRPFRRAPPPPAPPLGSRAARPAGPAPPLSDSTVDSNRRRRTPTLSAPGASAELSKKKQPRALLLVSGIEFARNASTASSVKISPLETSYPLAALQSSDLAASRTQHKQAFWRSKMGRKDASTIKLPVDQYRKQIGKQDYKKTKPILRATKLKAEAKKTAIGIKSEDYREFFEGQGAVEKQQLEEVGLVLAAILALLLAFYAFFYLRLSTDVDPDLERDED
uniref:Triple QxxK/R motif-containing protein n=3 Tax=Canis lupus TaxID=9612 RepID=A0A8I3S2V0_CANLF